MREVLIVGSLTTTHIRRLIGKLGSTKMPDENIYVMDTSFRVDYSNPEVDGIKSTYGLKSNLLFRVLSKIPKARVFAFYYLLIKQFKLVLSSRQYNMISFVGVSFLTSYLIRLAHEKGTKTHIAPMGSDVLRTSKYIEKSLKNAFNEVDYISVGRRSDFGVGLINRFNIPSEKMIAAGFGSDVIDQIDVMRGGMSRLEMASMLNLPDSSYYVSCGYNANIEQNHEEMLRAIADNKDLLPKDYCVIVQLSYGIQKEELKLKLPKLAQELELNVYLITEFLSTEQVAALRLITDLFIHVQKTDATNASILEYLLADTEVINGEWLKYRFIEQDGKPYHTCESLEQLSSCVRDVISNQDRKILVTEKTKQAIREFKSWHRKLKNWHKLFEL